MRAINEAVLMKAKIDYVTNKQTTINEIAKKYNLNYNTLYKYSQNNEWTKIRRLAISEKERALISEINQTDAKTMVKEGKEKLLLLIRPAIETLTAVMEGKGGRGSYNRFLAAKDALDRAGLKGDDNINLKVSRIMDSIESISVTVSASPKLSTGKPEVIHSPAQELSTDSDKIHYVNKDKNKDIANQGNASNTTTGSSEVIHSHNEKLSTKLSTGENIPQSGPIPGAGQAVDCAPAGNAVTGRGEGEGSITNIPSVTEIKKEE